MDVWIGDKGPCTGCVFDPNHTNDTQSYTCKINTNHNTGWVHSTHVAVALFMPANDTMASLGRGATGVEAFKISISALDFFADLGDEIAANPIAATFIFLGIIIYCALYFFCCCYSGKKVHKRRQERQQNMR